MMNRSKTVAMRSGLAACLCGLLTACGGGGSSGDASAPSGGGGTGSNPPPSTNPALTGQLWHNNYPLDYLDGTQIASPTGGLPQTVTSKTAVSPWTDGRQYLHTEWDTYSDTTRLLVVDRDTGLSVVDVTVNGHLRGGIPSPADKSVASFVWSSTYQGDDSVGLLVDLPTLNVLRELDPTDTFSWLPDGSYLRVSADGSIRQGQLSVPDTTVVGQLQIPTGLSLGSVWVNRQGDRLAVRLIRGANTLTETDLWVANIDGSGLRQFTATKISYFPTWSPDGQYIAFDVDTGHLCTGAGCIGTCELWYAPVTATMVTALQAVHDAERFKVKNRSGSVQTLGCSLLAWTD
jgi:WD40-like Beta Propeller Repeat